jgi:hypothetical protein
MDEDGLVGLDILQATVAAGFLLSLATGAKNYGSYCHLNRGRSHYPQRSSSNENEPITSFLIYVLLDMLTYAAAILLLHPIYTQLSTTHCDVKKHPACFLGH